MAEAIVARFILLSLLRLLLLTCEKKTRKRTDARFVLPVMPDSVHLIDPGSNPSGVAATDYPDVGQVSR